MDKYLGCEATCLITGYKGIATAKVEYINGCIQYCVKPKSKDGNMPDGYYIDIEQLKFGKKVVEMNYRPTGGPQMDCPKN